MEDMYEEVDKLAIILPLYLYDHSGITMNTTGFSCQWNSGQVGYIYCTKERFIEETGYSKQELFKNGKAEKMLKTEVETYDQYLTGNVYGFELHGLDSEVLNQYLKENNKKLEDIDYDELEEFFVEENSCWGFYGDDFKTNGLSDYLSKDIESLVDNL